MGLLAEDGVQVLRVWPRDVSHDVQSSRILLDAELAASILDILIQLLVTSSSIACAYRVGRWSGACEGFHRHHGRLNRDITPGERQGLWDGVCTFHGCFGPLNFLNFEHHRHFRLLLYLPCGFEHRLVQLP